MLLRFLLACLLAPLPGLCLNEFTHSLFDMDSSCDSGNRALDYDLEIRSTINLINNAITALDKLIDVNTRFPIYSSRGVFNQDYIWMRLATHIWATGWYPRKGPLSEADRTKLKTVRSNYQKLQAFLTPGGDGSSQKSKNILVCDESNYKQTQFMRDIDKSITENPGPTIREAYKGKFSTFFVAPGHARSNQERAAIAASGLQALAGTVCAPETTVAFVTTTPPVDGQAPDFEANQLVLCPPFFNIYRRMSPTELEAAHSDPNNAPSIGGEEPEDFLDYYRSRPGDLLHEFFHLIYPGLESYDWPFKYKGRTAKPYGVVNIFTISHYQNEIEVVEVDENDPSYPGQKPDVLKLPDAYRLFAEGAYIKREWSEEA